MRGTSPTNADTDGNGWCDGQEVLSGRGDSLNPTLRPRDGDLIFVGQCR